MIEKNVMKIDKYENSITFRLACDCTDHDHDTTITFERDKKVEGMYFIYFHKMMVWSCYWGHNKWFPRQWRKIKALLKLLFTGYIEIDEEIVLRGEEHINSFIKALEEGKKHMKGE